MTSISYSKIILSVGMIVFVAAMVVAGTGAFFSDTETSTGNVFAAGDIDLQIGNESYAIDHNIPGYENPTGEFVATDQTSWELTDLTIEQFFDFVDLKPGDYGEDTISIRVGSNDAYVCAAANVTADDDNDITEPEDEEAGSNSDNDDGTPDGDLDSELNFAFWVDDGDNVLETDEVDSVFVEGSLDGIGELGPIALADSDESIFAEAGPVPGDETVHIAKAWCFGTLTANPVTQDGESDEMSPLDNTGILCDGSGATNLAQTDSVEGDLEFYAVQSRNNEEFQCSDWDPGFEGQQPSVGAVLSAYTEPSSDTCNLFVDGVGTGPDEYETIQEAETAAADGDVICVDTGDYVENVTVDVPNLTILGLNDPKGPDAATVDGRMDIDSDGVSVRGLEFTNPDAGYALVANGVSDLEIAYNSFVDVATTLAGGSAQAVFYNADTNDASNVSIHNNMIDQIGNTALVHDGSGSAKGIYIGDSAADGDLSNLTITNNMITNVYASDAAWPAGRGAYGIHINIGATSGSGETLSPVIEYNTLETLAGLWSHGIGLEGPTPGATVAFNDVADLSENKGDTDAWAVFLEDNTGVGTVSVNYNNFASNMVGGVGNTVGTEVDAENNWWGDTDPSDDISGLVDYDPFESSAFPLN